MKKTETSSKKIVRELEATIRELKAIHQKRQEIAKKLSDYNIRKSNS